MAERVRSFDVFWLDWTLSLRFELMSAPRGAIHAARRKAGAGPLPIKWGFRASLNWVSCEYHANYKEWQVTLLDLRGVVGGDLHRLQLLLYVRHVRALGCK